MKRLVVVGVCVGAAMLTGACGPKIVPSASGPSAAPSASVAPSASAPAAAGPAPGTTDPTKAPPSDGGDRSRTIAANPYSPIFGHPYRQGAVPTRTADGQMRSYASTHAGEPTGDSTGPMHYNGGVDGIGVTTGTPRVYLVFYGSQWGRSSTDANGNLTFSGDPAGAAPRLQQMFKGIGKNNETWSGVMTQYCEGIPKGLPLCPPNAPHVGYPTGGALAGVWADTRAASPKSATGHQLGEIAVAAAAHFGNPTAAANRSAQYVIVSPHGTTPDGFNTPKGGFCAWHDWNGDTTLNGGAVTSTVGDVAFTNMPYVSDAGAGCGQGFVNAGRAGTLDGLTMTAGHEYAETITDQNPAGGWIDQSGQENADKCAWITSGPGASANVTFATGTFAMQTTWSNDANGCRMSHAVVSTFAFPGTGQ